MTRLVRILLAAVVGALTLGGPAATPAGAESPAPDRATARYEVDFLTGMIDHHAMAVHMSEMCIEKAVHEELQMFCEQIVATQSSEIEMMQSWLQGWYGVSHEPSIPPGDMRKMEGMATMEPAEFEIEFMEMMIRHHRQAIREAGGCVDRASHAELVDLCEDIVETQAAEIEMMQTWLCEWYDRCRGPRGLD